MHTKFDNSIIVSNIDSYKTSNTSINVKIKHLQIEDLLINPGF